MLKAHDEVILKHGSGEEGNLPADGTALVQRIVVTAGTQRLHDDLDVGLALAAQLDHAERILSVDDGRMDIAAVAAAAGDDAGRIGGVDPLVGHARRRLPAELDLRGGSAVGDLLDAHQGLGVVGGAVGVGHIHHLAGQPAGFVLTQGRSDGQLTVRPVVGRAARHNKAGNAGAVALGVQVGLIGEDLAVVYGVELHVVDRTNSVPFSPLIVLINGDVLPVAVLREIVVGLMVNLRVEETVREGLRTLFLQVTHGLFDHSVADLVSAADGSPGRNPGRIHDVQTGADGITANGVDGQSRLPVQPVRHGLSLAVNVPQVDFIGVAHPAAVVLGHDGEGRLFEVLAVRGHAFKQGLGDGREFGVAEERYVLAVVLRLFDHLGIVQISQIGFHVLQSAALEVGFQQGRGNTRIVTVVHRAHSLSQ